MKIKNETQISIQALLPGLLVERIKDEMFYRDMSKSEAVRWLLLQAWERRKEIILDKRIGQFDTRLFCYQPFELVNKVRAYAEENKISLSVALQKFLEDGLEKSRKERMAKK